MQNIDRQRNVDRKSFVDATASLGLEHHAENRDSRKQEQNKRAFIAELSLEV